MAEFLEAHTFYHLYNQGNNRVRLFYLQENYAFFLSRYRDYLSDYVDTYAYCLLSNHFHLLIKTKTNQELFTSFKKDFPKIPKLICKQVGRQEWELEKLFLVDEYNAVPLYHRVWVDEVLAWSISERMRRFMMSYSKAINKQEGRSGSLFQRNFRRKKVEDDLYLRRLIWYIHNNPKHHGFSISYNEYKWSSYQTLITNQTTKLKRKEVITLFGSRTAFLHFHQENHQFFLEEDFRET